METKDDEFVKGVKAQIIELIVEKYL